MTHAEPGGPPGPRYAATLAATLQLRPPQVAAAMELLDSGNTIPFIARYRKEQTAGLDEEQLRQVSAALETIRALDQRRTTILAEITAQGQLTPELRAQLLAAATRTELEDLYQPYKPKRRTRASIARDQGLGPLAALITAQPRTGQRLDELIAPFL
ncbi:MAG TPA: Tex-like N-terminal domain-containing protein, partial [Chloroflexia bacterium]|nr:Tex-like N-terminal domain-containing protein [Chloroflexia bacterium]